MRPGCSDDDDQRDQETAGQGAEHPPDGRADRPAHEPRHQVVPRRGQVGRDRADVAAELAAARQQDGDQARTGRRGPPRPGRAARARRGEERDDQGNQRVGTDEPGAGVQDVDPQGAEPAEAAHVVVTEERDDPPGGQERPESGTAVSSHGVRDTVALPMPRGTPWASSHPSAPTENAVGPRHGALRAGDPTSSTGSAMASSDRAAADAPATTARRRNGHPCRAMASGWRSGGGRDRADS